MEASDWTPAVLITATISLMTAGLVWLVTPWSPGAVGGAGHTIPRRMPRAEVVVWTGEVAPGLKAVLGPVWGDPKPDRHHDERLNADLGLAGDRALAYYRLLVFNTTAEEHSLALGEGQIVMLGETGGSKLPLRSLARMVERGEVEVHGGLEFSLRSLGALATTVAIPAGSFAKFVVPFDGAASIETARAIATKDGKELRRRQIAQAAFRRLVEDPDESQVKDL
jgi:hypothetical protein